jgi:hypothetical protein
MTLRKAVPSLAFAVVLFFLMLAGCSGDSAGNPGALSLRAFPVPFRAMLALCSDIDATTPYQFAAIHRFLNTREETDMGMGLGLDVGDSFWMFMGTDVALRTDRHGSGQDAVMTWFAGTSEELKDADLIVYYYEKGWIDSIHSWGDFNRVDENEFTFRREMAERGAAALSERGVRTTIWINHGNAANSQNFEAGSRDTHRQGARPGTGSYHADITVPALGIKYIWFSDNDTRFGRHDILYPVTLADGQKVWGFRRYTPGWSIWFLQDQLSDDNLDAIVREGFPVVVAQHFGGTDLWRPFTDVAADALRGLAERHHGGEILVARTSRMLEYLRVRDHLVYERSETAINILGIDDPQLGYDANPPLEYLRGITFYVENMARTEILLNSRPVSEDMLLRARDETGRETVGIIWFREGE